MSGAAGPGRDGRAAPAAPAAAAFPWYPGRPAPAPEARARPDFRPDILGVVVSRAAMFAVLFWVTLGQPPGALTRALVHGYGLATALYLATWAWSRRKADASPAGAVLYVLFLAELGVEAALFLGGQGYLSDYGALFVLTILTSGFFFRYWGAVIMATLASVLFAYAVTLHLGLNHLPGADFPPMPLDTMQARFCLFTALFYLVALLSSSLSTRLSQLTQELAGTHRAMASYRFSAEHMMNNLPNGLMFFDAEGRLAYRNRWCDEFLGGDFRPGMRAEEIFPCDSLAPVLREELQARAREFRPLELELEQGSLRPMRIQVKPLFREGDYVGSAFTMMDFTERKKMEARLLRSERMAALGQMSAKIAHEIRNPLASISGSAQMLGEEGFRDETEKRLLSLIVAESARLDRTLSSLLDYAREPRPTFREVSISSLFKKILMVLEKNPNFKPRLVFLRQFVQNGDIHFLCDRDILFQVLLNLGLNALQALPPEGGEVALAAGAEADTVTLEVRDTGRGMAEEEAARAFEPFYTTKPDGTGLGLAACLHYVQALDGQIRLRSEPGRGTTATITLPRKDA